MKRGDPRIGRAAGAATVRVAEDGKCNESGRAPFARGRSQAAWRRRNPDYEVARRLNQRASSTDYSGSLLRIAKPAP